MTSFLVQLKKIEWPLEDEQNTRDQEAKWKVVKHFGNEVIKSNFPANWWKDPDEAPLATKSEIRFLGQIQTFKLPRKRFRWFAGAWSKSFTYGKSFHGKDTPI